MNERNEEEVRRILGLANTDQIPEEMEDAVVIIEATMSRSDQHYLSADTIALLHWQFQREKKGSEPEAESDGPVSFEADVAVIVDLKDGSLVREGVVVGNGRAGTIRVHFDGDEAEYREIEPDHLRISEPA